MKKIVSIACACIYLFSYQQAFGAAILTFSALPLGKGSGEWFDRFLYVRASDDPSPLDLDLEVFGDINILAYGLTSEIYVFGAVPYLEKNLEFTVPEGRFKRSTAGIADSTYALSWEFLQRDYPGKTIRARVYGGFEAPTGDDNEIDEFGVLPQPLQLGSGSWDGVFSNYYSIQCIRWELSQEFTYKLNTEANDFEFGDAITHNTALSYMIHPWNLDRLDEMLYDFMIVLELNGVWAGHNEFQGGELADSGGYTLFISPGVQVRGDRWILEAIIQLPVVQDLNGTQVKTDYILTTGFRFSF